jgi:hypothetical protein
MPKPFLSSTTRQRLPYLAVTSADMDHTRVLALNEHFSAAIFGVIDCPLLRGQEGSPDERL